MSRSRRVWLIMCMFLQTWNGCTDCSGYLCILAWHLGSATSHLVLSPLKLLKLSDTIQFGSLHACQQLIKSAVPADRFSIAQRETEGKESTATLRLDTQEKSPLEQRSVVCVLERLRMTRFAYELLEKCMLWVVAIWTPGWRVSFLLFLTRKAESHSVNIWLKKYRSNDKKSQKFISYWFWLNVFRGKE